MISHLHTPNTCICPTCLGPNAGGMSRRGFLGFAGATSLGLALASLSAWGEERPPACTIQKPFEAMVLSCIDPRIIDQVHYYMDETQKLRCNYSQFVFAGAAVGAVAPLFRAWRETFWQNLGVSIRLHQIKKVFAIDHRNCSAAKEAYGEHNVTPREKETATHKRVLMKFKQQASKRHRKLEVITGLMDLDGKVEIFT